MQSKWKVSLGAFPVIRGKTPSGERAGGRRTWGGGREIKGGGVWMNEEKGGESLHLWLSCEQSTQERIAFHSPPFAQRKQREGRWYSTSMVWDWCMALIAFCAIALVENVTNAQPVGNKGTGSRKDKKQQDKRFGRLLNQHSLRELPQDDTVLSSTWNQQLLSLVLISCCFFTYSADLLIWPKQRDLLMDLFIYF